jgi:predicted HTH domain antitoxin
MKRTNVILTDEQHKRLKSLARKGGKTLGELVRDAVDAAYAKRDALEQRKAAAIDSYREGFISLGKLADALGIDTVTARLYLRERGIVVNVQDASEITADAANA